VKILTSISILLLSLCLFVSPEVNATRQAKDVIVVDGKAQPLFFNSYPLTPYLAKHPDAIPFTGLVNSGNQNGYVATWEVLGKKLFLKKVDVPFEDSDAKPDQGKWVAKNILKQMFPDSKHHVLADWYSGALVLPKGNGSSYVEMGYESTYERYLIFIIKSGVVSERHDFSAQEFEKYRHQRFDIYKRSAEYAAKVETLKKQSSPSDSRGAESFENFLYHSQSEHYLLIDVPSAKRPVD
jgi:hypothetical protein